MRKIREIYLLMNGPNKLKMKVSVAARTMSRTVAATIESMIGSAPNKLPNEAIYTAEFVNDVDSLFDSLNGNSPSPEFGKPLRRCVSKKSRHHSFWQKMIPRISSWEFHDKHKCAKKTVMPFKSGWIQTIKATQDLYVTCQNLGMTFLRTRSLNQDSLENTFAVIRQCGAANTNPNCFHFIAALKTCVLNSLISTNIKNKNCEDDDGSILDNLESFLTDHEDLTALSEDFNEIENFQIQTTQSDMMDGEFDTQAVSYVTGYLVTKLRILDCVVCKNNLLAENIDPHHTFIMFKEFDEQRRLKYVTKDLIYYISHVYDIIKNVLCDYGYILNIQKKLKLLIIKEVNFSWFTCSEHFDQIQSDLLNLCIPFIIRKYLNDLDREWQSSNKKTKKKSV